MWLPDPRESRAVLIGTSRYAEPGRWPHLPAVEANLADLHKALTHPQRWGLPPEHCTSILNATDPGLVSEAIHVAAMEARDTLLVYYAGHGATTHAELLLTLSATTSDNMLFRTLRFNTVRDIVQQRRARHAVVLLDSCFSGMAHWMGDIASFIHQQMSATSAFVLTSSARDSVSLSPQGERHTAFTGELIKVLANGVDGGPELLSLGAIARTVSEGLLERRMPVPQYSQTGTGHQVALTRNARWRTAPPSPAAAPPRPSSLPTAAPHAEVRRAASPGTLPRSTGEARARSAPDRPRPAPAPPTGRPDAARPRPAAGPEPQAAPQVTLATLGHVDHGKTTLTAAITHVLRRAYPHANRSAASFADVDTPTVTRMRGIAFSLAHVEYRTRTRHYTHIDCPGHADYVKGMITGAAQMDGAILVVAVPDGPMPQTVEQIRLAREVGVPYLVVALNKADLMQDEEILELIELEVRELLSEYGFPGDDVPVVAVSALRALEGDKRWSESVLELMRAVDDTVPEPVRAVDKPFLMPVEDVFTITGRGTIVTGRVERGVLKVDEPVDIVGIQQKTIRATVTGIEMFRKLLDEGRAGENVGMLLRGVAREDVERGRVLARPGSVTAHTTFEAHVYILSKDEGGRHQPFFNNYRPQFYFRTTDVTGVVSLPEGTEIVMPGDHTEMTVELVLPVAMEEGLKFALREGGRTVGAGLVTRVLG